MYTICILTENFVSKEYLEPKYVHNMLESGLTYVLFRPLNALKTVEKFRPIDRF